MSLVAKSPVMIRKAAHAACRVRPGFAVPFSHEVKNMKKILPLIAITALLASRSGLVLAQTADDVVEKHLAAIGGREALGKLRSRIVSGSITLSTPGGDVTGTIEAYAKAPNKSRGLIKVDLSSFGAGQLVVDQRFDGTSGYVIDTLNGNRDITGKQLDIMRSGFFPTPLLKYKESGAKVELTGKEKVGSRDAHVLRVTLQTGTALKHFIDAEDFTLLKTLTMINAPQLGGEVEQTVEFSDYRDVDGVKIPYKSKSSNSAQTFTITVTKVEHNTEIDDKSFSKPAAEK